MPSLCFKFIENTKAANFQPQLKKMFRLILTLLVSCHFDYDFLYFLGSNEGPLYPFPKFIHVKILSLFMCHEKLPKFFHVHAKIKVNTFHV